MFFQQRQENCPVRVAVFSFLRLFDRFTDGDDNVIHKVLRSKQINFNPLSFHTPLGRRKVTKNDLITYIVPLNLQAGIENSLDAKLGSALTALEDLNSNNDVAAVNSLEAFINQVEGQRGTKLTDEQADSLISFALSIIDSLAAE